MFMGIMMVCGIPVLHPNVVDTCALVYTQRPSRTVTECILILDSIPEPPEPGYIVYEGCINLGTPDPNV